MKRIQCLQQPMKNESFAHNDAHKLNLFLLLYMLFIEKNFWVLQLHDRRPSTMTSFQTKFNLYIYFFPVYANFQED